MCVCETVKCLILYSKTFRDTLQFVNLILQQKLVFKYLIFIKLYTNDDGLNIKISRFATAGYACKEIDDNERT